MAGIENILGDLHYRISLKRGESKTLAAESVDRL